MCNKRSIEALAVILHLQALMVHKSYLPEHSLLNVQYLLKICVEHAINAGLLHVSHG